MTMSSELLDDTLRLLGESPQPMPQIAQATGLNVWWLRKLRQGVIANPGVVSIERLHGYLAQQQNPPTVGESGTASGTGG